MSLAQINCNDSLIYWIKGASPFIKVLNPLQPLGVTNPSNTNIPLPPPGINNAFVLALMPNINGGLVSPTFYSVLANSNTITYWNGSSWINTGHAASNNNGRIMGLAGCNGILYGVELPFSLTPTIATVYKYVGTGPAQPIFTVTPAYNSPWYNWDLITDCHCNFYSMLTGSFNKYDSNGLLLSSTQVTGSAIGWYTMATVGNTIYTAGYNAPPKWANMLSAPISFSNIPTNGPYMQNPDDFASCPIDLSTPFTGVIHTNTLVCQPPTASLSITSTLSTLNYTWSGPGVLSPFNGSVVNVSAPGIYTCALSQGNCEYNRDTLITTVISNISVVAPVITPTNNLCLGPNQQLFSSLAGTLYTNQWQGPLITGGGNSATVSIGSAGMYSLTTTNVSNGCAGTTTANVLPVPIVSLGLSTNTLCVFSGAGNNTITLTSTGASHYTLVASPGFTFNTQALQPVAIYLTTPFPAGGIIGTAQLIGSNGVCTASASAGFSVLPVTKISATPSSTLVCLGKSLPLYASGAVTYTWLPAEGISSYNDSTVIALIGGPTIYSVTGTDKYGCNSFPETVFLSVRPTHKGSLTSAMNVYCVPFSGGFNFIPAPETGNSFSSEWAVNNSSFSKDKFSYLFKEPGTYTLHIKITDSLYQCSNTLDFFVETHPKPIADFSYSPLQPDELNNEVHFSPITNEFLNFEWFFADNTNPKSQAQHPSYTFNRAGIYPVALVVKNSWGCSDTAVKAVEIKEDFTFYVPNAFTPNEDEKNDLFLPLGRSIKLYNMKIFDRWGELIFETNDLLAGWDGNYKTLPCKNDIYIWKVQLSTNSGQLKTLNGSVSLMR